MATSHKVKKNQLGSGIFRYSFVLKILLENLMGDTPKGVSPLDFSKEKSIKDLILSPDLYRDLKYFFDHYQKEFTTDCFYVTRKPEDNFPIFMTPTVEIYNVLSDSVFYLFVVPLIPEVEISMSYRGFQKKEA